MLQYPWVKINLQQRGLPSNRNLLPIQLELYTVEPAALQTPALYGQFRLSRQKAHIFSLKLTHFIRTPFNADNGPFSVS